MHSIIADHRRDIVQLTVRGILLLTLALGAGCSSRNKSFTFVHITDIHVGTTDREGSRAAAVAASYREISTLDSRPVFVVNTGDLTELGTDAEFAVHRKILSQLAVPSYATPGNHDIRWNPLGKEGYELGAGRRYQSWDHAGVHFVLLDSTVLLQHWGHVDQEQLDWLKDDLRKIGVDKPIVIGLHHPVGRDGLQVDNEPALLELVRPYNVRLWLFGHGHSDLQWNLNGAAAIEAKGLYQGSYHLIQIEDHEIRVHRRTDANSAAAGSKSATPVVTIPLARNPGMDVSVAVSGNQVLVKLSDNRADAAAALRIDGRSYTPMIREGDGFTAELPADLLPGEHVITARVTCGDGETYFATHSLKYYQPDRIVPAWQTDLKAAVQSHLVHHHGRLYVTTMAGDLLAIDAQTGRESWRFHTAGAAFSTPCVSDGVIYFGSADHGVYAVHATNGQLKWKTMTRGGIFAGPALARGIVCIPSVDKTIYGLDASTGQVRWTAPIEGMYQSNVATDGERFFLGGWDNYLRCLDARTGQQRWAIRLGKSMYFAPAIASPAVGEGKVFITSNDGVLHAVDAASGNILWEYDGKKLGYSSPLYHAGRVYTAIGESGGVFCFDAANGRLAWQSSAGSSIYDSSFTFAADHVYIGSVNGTVSAFRASDGARQWQYSLGTGHLLASPTADEQRVFIVSMNGKLTALPMIPPATDRLR